MTALRPLFSSSSLFSRWPLLLLLATAPARADELDPWGLRSPAAPEEPAPPSAPSTPPPAVAPVEARAAPASPPIATEIRETWDPAGHLIRRLTLSQGRLIEETTFQYDAAGRVVEQRSMADGHLLLETRAYNPDGSLSEQLALRDGALERREVNRYEAGRRVQQDVEDTGGRRTTTWTHDRFGGAVLVEKRDARGLITERTVADRMDPKVPVSLSLDGGLSTSSDVDLSQTTAGFTFVREPPPTLYGRDPVEVKLSASYTRGNAGGIPTTDELKGGFAVDYNYLWPRLTPFFFAVAERNPVANLELDLEVAPVGLKLDIIDVLASTRLDLSFAPLWGYRAITVPAGGDCEGEIVLEDTACQGSTVRGSFRLKFGYEAKRWSLLNTAEFLPSLRPENDDFLAAIDEESISRDTVELKLKLSSTISISETFSFTRDVSLADQVDCEADPDNRLCDGQSLQSTGLLSLRYTFK